MKISTLSIDLAKNVFQVAGFNSVSANLSPHTNKNEALS